MPKRQLTKRADGRYSRQIYIGKDENKKRKYRTVYGDTPKEVDEKINELRTLLSKGIDIDSRADTFSVWAEKYKKLKKAEVSYRYYQGIESHLKQLTSLNNIEISKIKPIHLQEILIELANDEKRPLSKKTLGDIRNAARGVMALAVDNRVIEYNPFDNVKIPSGKGKKKREAITEEQIKWIEETPNRAQIAAMIMLYAGLRRGEMIALTWNDINLKDKTISINKAVEFKDNNPILKTMTKTAAGMRLISIPQKLVDFLSKQQIRSIIVLENDGQMYTDGAWRAMWSSYMSVLNEKYGNFDADLLAKTKKGKKKSRFAPGGLPTKIKKFTAHQLRHTYATMLYQAGIDVLTAKEMLGHADIKTTLNIYTHLDSAYKKNTMTKLDDYLTEKDNKKEASE